MTKPVKTRRRYDSSRRKEQALATRRAVLDAARELFIESGYVTTSIEEIAHRARVSPETIYATFKTKRGLLSGLLDVSIAGDDAPVPILERHWVKAMREEPDPLRRVQILAKNGTAILERRAAIDAVLRGAASADAEIAALWEASKAQRYEGQRVLAGIIAAGGSLRPGLTASAAADILYTVGNSETYSALVGDRGWSVRRFEKWLADSFARLLLA